MNQVSQLNQDDATNSFSRSENSNFDSNANLDMLFEKMETAKTRKLERLTQDLNRKSNNLNDISIGQEEFELSNDTDLTKKANRRTVQRLT